MALIDKIKSWFAPVEPLSREILHYQTPPDAEQQYRLHLRVEEDGRGLLVVNAATVLHLNQTATEHARLIIQGLDEEEAARTIAQRYRVSRRRARADFARLKDHIQTLATTPDLDPVTFLDMERVDPFSAETSAPYRVDLALTYRVDEAGKVDREARKRVDRELDTEEWKQILQLLWNEGVPHICFTGGEPTLRRDLVDLVRYAEDLGLVTGLLTDGRLLRDQPYLNELLMAGLDHLQVTLESSKPEIHDSIVGQSGAWAEADTGIGNAVEGDIYVVVHIVVTPANADTMEETITYLVERGVHAVALSSPLRSVSDEEHSRLQEALSRAQQAAHANGLTVVWDLAAPYSYVNPIEIDADLPPEQVVRQHLYVEPDGDALPAQGYNVVLGNLLQDPWENIWNHVGRSDLGD
jgi:MoaA/NifB/PqqE/SkfB family radical SAM enzyme